MLMRWGCLVPSRDSGGREGLAPDLPFMIALVLENKMKRYVTSLYFPLKYKGRLTLFSFLLLFPPSLFLSSLASPSKLNVDYHHEPRYDTNTSTFSDGSCCIYRVRVFNLAATATEKTRPQFSHLEIDTLEQMLSPGAEYKTVLKKP